MTAHIDILFLGDIILDVPDPDHWLSGIADVTRTAHLAIGHLEVPHTRRGKEMKGDVPAPGAEPAHLAAIARANIGLLSTAGNHIADCGAIGIADTLGELDRLGIAHAGAGANLALARKPAIVEVGNRRIGLLSFNCVGPEMSWATDDRAGSAYVHFVSRDGAPSSPQADLVVARPDSLGRLQADITGARSQTDFLVVALHKGITHRPADLAPYERPLAQFAIDAGADVVVGHHAHIARGIEFHCGRPIFHGLGNGCVVTHALSPGQDHAARAAWVERRKALFGFEPDPAYPLAPFHPEAVNGMIGRCRLHLDGRIETSFLPIWFEPPGRPVVPVGNCSEAVADYVDMIGIKAGLPPLLRTWDDGWARLH
jgi:poly-gamma-glutamate synthesis protein (capsule biosynthesis protein)